MKRIFVLCLALIFTIGTLAVPSFAAEADDPTIFNMLTALEYDLYTGNKFSNSTLKPSYFASSSAGLTDYGWEFEYQTSVRFNKIVCTVQASRVPDLFYLNQRGGIGNVQGEYLGSVGNFHTFVFTNIDITDTFYFRCLWPTVYSGDFNLVSCYGFITQSLTVTSLSSWFCNAVYRSVYYDDEYQEWVSEFYYPYAVGSGSNTSLPMTSSFSGPGLGQNYDLTHGEFFGKVKMTSAYLDSGAIVLFTSGKIESFGVRLEDSSGTPISGVSSWLEYFGETQMVFELDENYERIHMYVLHFDLFGLRLSDRYLAFDVNVTPVWGGASFEYGEGFFCQVNTISLFPTIEELPWYSVFADWLGKQFDRLIDAFNPDGDSSGFQDQVDQQGDRLDQMDDALNSVTKPALDRVDTDISGIVSDTDLSNVANVYTYVIDDNIMAPSLTMVTILAMMSFALFGKR